MVTFSVSAASLMVINSFILLEPPFASHPSSK
jgi:hypothetical protein